MQPFSKTLRFSSLSYRTRVWIGMLLVLILSLGTVTAQAAIPAKAAVILSQANWLSKYPGGGAIAGSMAAGTSFGVNSKGDVVFSTTYGGEVYVISGRTGAVKKVGAYGNIAAVAVDGKDNLYVSGQYGNLIVKVPYAGGTYTMAADPTATAPADCTGNDTAICGIKAMTTLGWYGTTSMAFDAQGNLFVATNDQGIPHAIFECSVACQAGTAGAAPVKLFQEPSGSKLYIGELAVDPWGNLFFNDSNIIASNTSANSDVNVLPYTPGVGYAATPTLLYALTIENPAPYGNAINGVAVGANGTVYFADHGGIYAFPNDGTALDQATVAANLYTVAPVGGKAMAIDRVGNLYAANYTSALGSAGDAIAKFTTNSVVVPKSDIGTPATSGAVNPVYTILNDGDCNSPKTVSFTAFAGGGTTTEFAAETTGNCSSTLTGGQMYATTITHTPADAGTPNATLVVSDSVNTGFANFTLTPAPAIANRAEIFVSQANWLGKYPGGGAIAGSMAAGTSFGVNSKGDVVFSTSYGGEVYVISAQTGATTKVGSYGNIAAVAVDGKDNLYVSGQYGNLIVKVPYAGGTYTMAADPTATAPADCTGNDTAICGIKAMTTLGWYGTTSMAFDAQGNLFVATNDQGIPHAIFECSVACQAGTAGAAPVKLFQEPSGSKLYIGELAVDPWGNLFFNDSNIIASNTSANSDVNVLPYTPGVGYAATPTLLYALTIENPAPYGNAINGVAVGANGTVYFADHSGIYAFLNNGGVLDQATVAASTYMVTSVGGKAIAIDLNGDLYAANYTSALGSAGDAIAKFTTNSVVVPKSAIGTASPNATTNPVTTILNGTTCTATPPAAVTFALDAASTVTAAAETTGNCGATLVGGAAFATTVSVTPAAPGINAASLTATDSASNATEFTATGSAAAGTATQTITFTNPGPQANGTSIALSATADSGLPVSFDSQTTDVCTVTGTQASFIAVGTCTIEATQLGDNTYGAATPVVQSFTINGPAATPTFSPVAGTYDTNQTVTISDATAGAVIHYTTDGSTPTASSSVYTQPITVAVTTTVKAIAIASHYQDSAVASGAFTITPGFGFSASANSVSVATGTPGTVTLTVNRIGGFNESVWFACSGLPAGFVCNFSPTAVMASEATTASTTLTISRQVSVFAKMTNVSRSIFASMMLCFPLGFVALGTRRRRLQMLMVLALTVAAIAMFVGCGGNSSSTPSTQPVNANITVTARSGVQFHSVTLTLTSK